MAPQGTRPNAREEAMALLVLKFGGTSVADIARIRNVAAHVKREADAGHYCAVVVSAMAGATNRLVALVDEAWGFKERKENGGEVSAQYDGREYDAVVSSGEQVTSGLLALVLQSMGLNARSWQGWQIPLNTDAAHRAARITGLAVDELKARMIDGEVAVVAGFQGIAPGNRISTLGRGGSDTSAVALGRGAPGRPLRHLYRRRRRLHDRPEDRAEGAPARPHLLRRDARNGLARGQGAADPLGRACHAEGASGCSCGRASIRRTSAARAPTRRLSLEHSFAMRMRSWSRTSSAELPMRGTRPR